MTSSLPVGASLQTHLNSLQWVTSQAWLVSVGVQELTVVAQWLCVCLQDACWVSRVVGVTRLSQGWPWLSFWLIPWAADRLWEGEAAESWIRKVMGRGGWGSLAEWIRTVSPKKGVLLCIHDCVCSSVSWLVPCHFLSCAYKCPTTAHTLSHVELNQVVSFIFIAKTQGT